MNFMNDYQTCIVIVVIKKAITTIDATAPEKNRILLNNN